MNKEIKEILDRLERIDHKEYSGGFEFADSGSFDETCRCFEERKELADYITNLQERFDSLMEAHKICDEENERLQQENERLKDSLETMTFTAKVKQETVDSLISRIDKAVEKINYYKYFISLTKSEEHMLNTLDNILQNGSENDDTSFRIS